MEHCKPVSAGRNLLGFFLRETITGQCEERCIVSVRTKNQWVHMYFSWITINHMNLRSY